MAGDTGLAELAAEAGLSARHCAATFRAATGTTPHRWTMARRIERGCDLLRKPRRSVTDVAMLLGFASRQHFATVFRKHMGATPSQYRCERLS